MGNTHDAHPRMSLEDQAALEEAQEQLGDVLTLVRGGYEPGSVTREQAVADAREATARARKVLTKFLRAGK